MSDKRIFVDFLDENGIDVEVVDKQYAVIYDTDRGHRLSIFVKRLTPQAIKNYLYDEFNLSKVVNNLYEKEKEENEEGAIAYKDVYNDVIKWRGDLVMFMDEYEEETTPKSENKLLAVYKTDEYFSDYEKTLVYLGTKGVEKLVEDIANLYDLNDDEKTNLLEDERVVVGGCYGLVIEDVKTDCYIG